MTDSINSSKNPSGNMISNASQMLPNCQQSLPYVTDYFASIVKVSYDKLEKELQTLLDDSQGVQFFSEFLEVEERAAHYLSFWFCCKGFKTAEETKIYDLIKGIYRKYIRSESKTAVALQPSTKKNIVDKISTKLGLDRQIFDEAQNEVWRILVSDLYARFTNSESFQRYFSQEKPTHQIQDLNYHESSRFIDTINDNEIPYVEYMTSSSSVAGKLTRGDKCHSSCTVTNTLGNSNGALPSTSISANTISGQNLSSQNQIQGNTNNNINSHSKDRRGIAETDPNGFHKQLTAKLEKLKIFQQYGRSLLDVQKLNGPIEDDPQSILDIHDSFVTKKEPQKLEQSLSSTSIKRDADIRSVVSGDSGVATTSAADSSYWNYSGGLGRPNYGGCMSPVLAGLTASPDINNQFNQQHNQSLRQHHRHWRNNNSGGGNLNSTSNNRRRNHSQDQSICSLEDNSSSNNNNNIIRDSSSNHFNNSSNIAHNYQMPTTYQPRKNKSQASDASSIFDSGVSSTYEQISQSWMITTDRVSHWIINQPPNQQKFGKSVNTNYNTTVNPTLIQSPLRRSSSVQTPSTLNAIGQRELQPPEVWIDDSSSVAQQPLIVGYYLCGDPVPYRTQVARNSNNLPFTLANFKQLLPRRGPYRYFFKRPCDEFEGGGAVHEEYTRDEDILPLWDCKIVAKVEKIE